MNRFCHLAFSAESPGYLSLVLASSLNILALGPDVRDFPESDTQSRKRPGKDACQQYKAKGRGTKRRVHTGRYTFMKSWLQ